jgi:hypothetical protein
MQSSQNLQPVTLFPKVEMGRVEKTITTVQAGRVRFQGSYWPAQFYNSDFHVAVNPDDLVTIVGRQGITLLVVSEACTLPSFASASIQSSKDNLRSAEWSQRLSAGVSSLLKLKRGDRNEHCFSQA